MAVQATHSLQDQVSRGQIGDQQIEVDIEGLLEYLGADHDTRAGHPAGLVAAYLTARITAKQAAHGASKAGL